MKCEETILSEKLNHDQFGTEKHHVRLWLQSLKTSADLTELQGCSSFQGLHNGSPQQASESLEVSASLKYLEIKFDHKVSQNFCIPFIF